MAVRTSDRVNVERLGTVSAVSVRHLTVQLGGRIALGDVSLDIAPGSFVGLLGPNGSGKSTLLRSVMGVLSPASGEVLVEGRNPRDARDLFSYLPQRQRVDLDAPIRVWDVVMMGRLRQTGWLRSPGREDREVAAWALQQVAMLERRNLPVGQLSFGQQQRVFLARALAQQGHIVLLDEPMNGVDAETEQLFVELLNSFHAEGKTIVLATHDLNMAACICDTLCILNQRLIAYGPVAATFRPDILKEAYGAHVHFVNLSPDGHAEVLEDVHHHPEGPEDALPSYRR